MPLSGTISAPQNCKQRTYGFGDKELILDNVDYKTDLLDKCITGGRLNAYKAVRAATEPQTFTGDVNGDGKDDIIMSRAINGKRAFTVYLGQSNGK